jgi:glycosyltransferase involved in cell wall biosynthesis
MAYEPWLKLAALCGNLHPHIHVLPNAIDLALPSYVAARTRSAKAPSTARTEVVIGWTGSLTHGRDFACVAPALERILEEYDGADGRPLVRLALGGDNNLWDSLCHVPGVPAFIEKVALIRLEEIAAIGFETIVSDCGRFSFMTPTSDIDAVPRMYDGVDIGVVPLRVGSAANTPKSDLKGLEMAGMGVPCIASPIPSYVQWRGQPGTGAIVLPDNETTSWLEALRRLIDDEQLRRRMADEALTFARTRSSDRWAPRWMDVYREAAARKGLAWAA